MKMQTGMDMQQSMDHLKRDYKNGFFSRMGPLRKIERAWLTLTLASGHQNDYLYTHWNNGSATSDCGVSRLGEK